MIEIDLSQGKTALIDEDDYDKVSQYVWHAHKSTDNAFYARCTKDRVYLYMHRLIMDAKDGYSVDHINGNRLDNRKSNLRICSHAQNLANRPKQANNKSGFKGVIFDKSRNKWRSEIRVDGKSYYLGRFDDKIDAAVAYNEKAIELLGEFAHLNEI